MQTYIFLFDTDFTDCTVSILYNNSEIRVIRVLNDYCAAKPERSIMLSPCRFV